MNVPRILATALTVLIMMLVWGLTLENAPAATIPETALVGLCLGVVTLAGVVVICILWPPRTP